jgi:hypothetical protein
MDSATRSEKSRWPIPPPEQGQTEPAYELPHQDNFEFPVSVSGFFLPGYMYHGNQYPKKRKQEGPEDFHKTHTLDLGLEDK